MGASGANVEASPGYRYRLERVTARVHLISQAEPFHVQPLGNVTVVEQVDGLVVIDAAGSAAAGTEVARMIRTVSDKPVKTIILTHWHADHVLGAASLLKEWPGAELLSTVGTRAHLAGPEMAMYPREPDPEREAALQHQLARTAARFAAAAHREGSSPEERSGYTRTANDVLAHAAALCGVRLVLPHRTLQHGQVIDDDRAPVEVRVPGPANTDGDAVVWLPNQRVLVTGDVVVAPFPFGFDVHPTRWAALLRVIAESGFRHLIPGHGPVLKDSRYLARIAAALDRVTDQVRAARSAGVAGGSIASGINAAAEIDAFAGSNPWLRRWVRAYWWEPVIASAIAQERKR